MVGDHAQCGCECSQAFVDGGALVTDQSAEPVQGIQCRIDRFLSVVKCSEKSVKARKQIADRLLPAVENLISLTDDVLDLRQPTAVQQSSDGAEQLCDIGSAHGLRSLDGGTWFENGARWIDRNFEVDERIADRGRQFDPSAGADR